MDNLKIENISKLVKFRAVQDLFKTLKSLGLTSFFRTFQTTVDSNLFLLYNFKNFEINQLKDDNKILILKSE